MAKDRLISPREAWKTIFRHVHPLGVERRLLGEACGACLAEDVLADRDMPPADRAAMDGYAVMAADLAHVPRELRLIGEVGAGSPARPRVRQGTCVRVATGANVPPGADTVVMLEQTVPRGEQVCFLVPVEKGANIFRRGEDARKGKVLLRHGTLLEPRHIGICAATGKTAVKVRRRPCVAILCTGDELRQVADKVWPHEVRNSTGPTVEAALREAGYDVTASKTIPDDVGKLVRALRRCASRSDAIIVTGGVSVGKSDYVRAAVERVEATVRFHGVAMKPGKPLLYATLPGNRHVFGLPGNPVSALTGFYLFALSALHRLAGLPLTACRPVVHLPLAAAVFSKGDRLRWQLVRVQWTKDRPSLMPLRSQSVADLVAGGLADGVAVVPASKRQLPAGTVVAFHPWRSLP